MTKTFDVWLDGFDKFQLQAPTNRNVMDLKNLIKEAKGLADPTLVAMHCCRILPDAQIIGTIDTKASSWIVVRKLNGVTTDNSAAELRARIERGIREFLTAQFGNLEGMNGMRDFLIADQSVWIEIIGPALASMEVPMNREVMEMALAIFAEILGV